MAAGREDRGKYGIRKGPMNAFASTTNKEKRKRKNPKMLKQALGTRLKRKLDMRTRQMQSRASQEKDRRNR